MKRFYHNQSNNWLKLLLSVSLFLMIFFGFFIGISNVSKETSAKQTESLQLAISRSIAHCYASKGYYPENLEYLQEHYGIHYDTDKYFIDYQVLGENIFPDVTIIEK